MLFEKVAAVCSGTLSPVPLLLEFLMIGVWNLKPKCNIIYILYTIKNTGYIIQ